MIKDLVLLEQKVYGLFTISSFRALLADGGTQSHVDFTKVEYNGNFEAYLYDGFSFETLHELLKYATAQHVCIYTYME